MPDGRKRQNIDITEFETFIDRVAKQSKRTRTQVIRLMLKKGMEAIKTEENNDLIG